MLRRFTSSVVLSAALAGCGGGFESNNTDCTGPNGPLAAKILERARNAGVKFDFPSRADDPNAARMVPDTASALGIRPDDPCLRDYYVVTAVGAAWAAEGEARLGRCDNSRRAAGEAMVPNLDGANRMCGLTDTSQCKTNAIWSCSDTLP
jgi:hypothetical protein